MLTISRAMFRKRLATTVGLAAAATLIWFLTFDWSWFEEDCPDCWHGRSVFQYRVFGYAVHEKTEVYTSELERACTDLGVPCSHPNLTRWHKHRWWGLTNCSCPCINGTIRVENEPDYYDRHLAAKIKLLHAERPEFGNIFRQRVLVDHDFPYWHTLLASFEAEEHPEQPELPSD